MRDTAFEQRGVAFFHKRQLKGRDLKALNCWLSQECHQQLSTLASDRGVSMGALIEKVVGRMWQKRTEKIALHVAQFPEKPAA